MIQIIAWSVVLGVTGQVACDRPLKLYLILTVVRLGLSIPCETSSPLMYLAELEADRPLPVLVHSAIVPPRPNRRDGPEQIAARELTRQLSSMERDRQIRR